MRKFRVAAVAIGLLAASACASTGKDTNHALNLTGSRDAAAEEVATSGDGTPATGAPETAAAVAAGSGAAKTVAGKIAGGGPAAANTGVAKPGGASKDPVVVGYYGTEATNGNQFGLNGQVLGDPKVIGQAMVDWLNAHGGLAGRPVKLVVTTTPLLPTTPQDQIDQAACARMTEDNHVFAVVSITLTTPAFYQCIAQHRTLYVSNTVDIPDQGWFMSHVTTLFSGNATQDRAGAAAADGLWRAGYFSDPGAKIGVITADHPWFTSGVDAFKKVAAQHGVNVAAVGTTCHTPCTTNEQAQEGANIVVKFRGQGINHVVLLNYESATAFMQAANSAGFYPRYGFDSYALPGGWPTTNTGPTLSAGGTAVGAGFMLSVDIARAQNPPLNPQTQLCEKIMRDAGINMENFGVEVQVYMTCDGFWLLKAAMDRAGAPDYAAMQGAVEGIAGSYIPANGFTAFYGPQRHDGSQTYRIVDYVPDCNCMRYRGGAEFPIPPLAGQPR
jgi:ABC-type branched-subunit amino acid transport system substrate-binding protein